MTVAALPQERLPVVEYPRPAPPSGEEQMFFRAANAERAARGLPAYKWSEPLAIAARKHAALMAKADELSHQLAGEPALDERTAKAGARFSSVGENVAIGPDATAIHTGWMESPGHRANILDAHFTALGVGVIEGEGQFYAVEDFSVAVENLSLEEQEEKVATVLKSRGFRVLDDRAEARKFCVENYAPAHRRAMAILRLESPDLNTVPEEMDRALRGHKYRQAEVGACSSGGSQKGIARFRVNILLFPDAEKALAK